MFLNIGEERAYDNSKVDVFSLGVTMIFMAVGMNPFHTWVESE